MAISLRSRARLHLSTGFAALAVLATAAAAEVEGPWSLLEKAKTKLQSAGPTTMDFVQTLTPAGFTGGDSENGSIDLDLPGCVRWDYEQPYPRSFLICGAVGYHWNQGEAVGRRFFVAMDEPGLDLLLQDRAELEKRYEASLTPSNHAKDDHGVVEILLRPREGRAGELIEARLEVDPKTSDLVSLSYRDREGNHNRFSFSNPRPLADQQLFTPPQGIAWSEE